MHAWTLFLITRGIIRASPQSTRHQIFYSKKLLIVVSFEFRLTPHVGALSFVLKAQPPNFSTLTLPKPRAISRYELFTDLCLAHWLTGTGRAGRVVWHTKVLPWFVSDASNADIEWMVSGLFLA